MKDPLPSEPSWATLIVVIVTVIVAVVGGIVCIVNPDSLSFDDYVKALGTIAIGGGALGIGRGIVAGAKTKGGFQADPQDIVAAATAPPAPAPDERTKLLVDEDGVT